MSVEERQVSAHCNVVSSLTQEVCKQRDVAEDFIGKVVGLGRQREVGVPIGHNPKGTKLH